MHFVYIMASRPGGALYVGRTSDLRQRVEQHRSAKGGLHTAKYKIDRLVWFEMHEDFETSLLRERRIKRWRRAWKKDLIMAANPHWRDVTGDVPYQF